MTGQTDGELKDAIATYHGLLEVDQATAERSAELLVREQGERHLMFGPNVLCSVLRPQFLSVSAFAHIQRVCHTLARAMFRLADAMLTDASLLGAIGLTPTERELVTVDPGFREFSPSTRLDSFMADGHCRFVEYNAESPAAIAYCDGLSELFAELPIMAAFDRTHRATPLPVRSSLRHEVLDVYGQWGGHGIPTIAIVDWQGVPTTHEFELFVEYFERSGIPAFITDPQSLEYDGQRLAAGGRPIDLVYKRVLTSELLAEAHIAEPMVRAYRDHRVCVVNSFRAKLLHKKMIFALLSDEHYASYFDDNERAVIDAHIPWTRRVAETTTTYAGRRIDLLPFLVEHREQMVLKPNDEYGGKGVVIGWEQDGAAWERALQTALASADEEQPYVAQERVPIERESFPVWEDGELNWVELGADLDPFLFDTQVQGVLTRLSSAALLNVTAGRASTAPTFLVERR